MKRTLSARNLRGVGYSFMEGLGPLTATTRGKVLGQMLTGQKRPKDVMKTDRLNHYASAFWRSTPDLSLSLS